MERKSTGGIVSFIFFGNYFYGACAVALSIEAALQQKSPLNHWLFYLLVFLSTVLYYTLAYITEGGLDINNKRSVWYTGNRRFISISQILLFGMFLVCAICYLRLIWGQLLQASLLSWVLLAVFPVAALLYYGSSGNYNLRMIGWLKPFVIGFAWAGLVTLYPVIFSGLEHGVVYHPSLFSVLLFIKNFMFISLLCILFDIKDYATDHNQQLKTFVVKIGLRRTISYIIIPLSILGLGTFLAYGYTHQFSMGKRLLNTIPFIALLLVAYSLHRRRPILYYLMVIDGLMLLKAVCGILAMIYF